MNCTCGRICIGSEVTENRNLDLDCPMHGTKSTWWNSPEQRDKREADNNRLRDLQGRAAEARRRAKNGLCIRCGEQDLHYIQPNSGDPGFYACIEELIDGDIVKKVSSDG